MKFILDHIGWVSNNIEKFEAFWCKGLDFKQVWESNISPAKVKVLFSINNNITIAKRYQKDNMVIEIHVFDPPLNDETNKFDCFGINHIGLWVEDREVFIEDLKDRVGYVEVKKYYDPSGWWNIFIRDLEGNWIELRTKL